MSDSDFGDTAVEYKQPLIDMFEDFKKRVENNELSNTEITNFYKSITLALNEDLKVKTVMTFQKLETSEI